ncbi:MAG: HNH endonuclease [Ginsengibacter sp.]
MPTWREKREKILKRDNFTCQICNQFNPEIGTVQMLNNLIGEMVVHEYVNHYDSYQSIYRLSSSLTGYPFEINFGDCWPVFPIMQVHHKRYINGREQWEYDDEDLITLCKNCHTNLHLNSLIPILSKDEILLEERMFLPVDLGNGRNHLCDYWTFIKQIGGGEYVITEINPTITMVLVGEESSQEAELEANKALDKFIKQYFPRYARGE